MADECKCTMISDIKRIKEDILKSEAKNEAVEKVVYEIKDGHAQTKWVMEQIQKTQDAQALSAEKYQLSQALANKEYQSETTRLNKEYQAENLAGFKTIEDRRSADEKALVLKKEADEKVVLDAEKAEKSEKLRLKEIQDEKDESWKKEKRAQTRAIWMVGVVILLNTAFGLLVKYFPKIIGL